jgi:hypothetical protein
LKRRRRVLLKTIAILVGVTLAFTLGYVSVATISIYQISVKPNVHLQKNIEKNIQCARDAGFIFIAPLARQMKPSYKTDKAGFAFRPPLNIILLKADASDWVVRHEIGHIIDYHSIFRTTHPIFKHFRREGSENFANKIAFLIRVQCEAAS